MRSHLIRNVVLLLIVALMASSPVHAERADPSADTQLITPRKVFIPMLFNDSTPTNLGVPKLLGVVPHGYWGTTTDNVQTMLKGLDSWSGKRHSIVGWFFDVREGNPDFNFKGQLDNLWVNGYTSFVNLGAGNLTSADIAQHKYDSYIRGIATAYASWVKKGGGRKAFIAPLQEMNGYWVSYGKDPANFKAAYTVIRQIFRDAGVPDSSVWWVFAPNGWGEDGQDFEIYYPGDDKVDVVAFSSYNFGYCPVGNAAWRSWSDYKSVFEPYVDRMKAMAPTKPIIIAQGATSAQYPSSGTYNHDLKNQWIMDTYAYIASEPNVMALLWFDINLENDGECDYEIYNGQYRYDGYKTAVSNQAFEYISPATLSSQGLVQ
ncbi:MAG TPA: glycosyl hydrolase [Anaerolineaceae bacterium]|nr:glycosyl hydrolase [Anaerolineaceae bacterium]